MDLRSSDRCRARSAGLVVAAVALLRVIAVAGPGGALPVPPGLEAGDRYHLIFTSSTRRDGVSGDIAVYDAHVQAAADAAGIGAGAGVSWSALVSVGNASGPQLDARDHVAVGESTPIYNMSLALVAAGAADLWDETITNGVSLDETGQEVFGDAWTGSSSDGTADPFEHLGSSADTAWCGRSFTTDATWLHYFNPSKFSSLHVFGLSEELVVEGAGTEPAFRRGDSNGDGVIDISDASYLLNWLFLGGEVPGCPAASNANGDGATDISDASYLLNFLFLGGGPPVAPHAACGPATLPTDTCETSTEGCD